MPKVLVIDDSVSVRKVVERALAGRQIEVVSAASGTEALERIERDAPDVIVCDVVMPDRDGYEICDFVKNHSRLGRTPVVLMSGIVNDEVRQRAARVRSEGVLAKPFAADDLLKRLEGFLGPLEAASAAPAVPVAMPTLMPVSPLAVEPLAPLTPEPLTIPPPRPLKPEPLTIAPPEPRKPARPEPLRLPPLEALKFPEPEPSPPSTPEPPTMPTPIQSPRDVPPPTEPTMPAPIPSRAIPTTSTPAVGDGTAAILGQFTAMDGVQWAVLADREGFVVEATTNAGVDAEVAAALSACLAESSDGLGRELGRGTLHGIILEYEKGMVVVYAAGAAGLLAVGLNESAVLGKVRYFAKKALPELTRVL